MRPWWLRLAKFAPSHWQGLSAVGLLMVVTAMFNALKPWPMKILVDSVFVGKPLPASLAWMTDLPGSGSPTSVTAWLAGFTLVIFLCAWTTQTLHAYIQSGVALRITYRLGARVFERLQQLSLRFHALQPTGDLIRRVTRDSRCARDVLVDVMLPAQSSLFTLLAISVMMFQLNAWLTGLTLLVVPAIAVAQNVFYRPMQECSLEQHRCEAAMQSQAEQALTAIPMVQAYRHEAWQASRFREATDRTLQAYFQGLAAQLKFSFCVNGATVLGQAVIMMVGGYLVLQGNLAVGGLLVFFAYVGMLYEPLTTLANLSSNLADAESSACRVFEILDAADAIPQFVDGQTATLPPQVRGEIVFENVSFAYTPGVAVLKDIDLQIDAGQTVALMGPSGSGKTTLISLLMRFFDPDGGCVRLDGVNIKQLTLGELRRQLAIMLQQPFLLPVTVAENIAYGRPDASREQIEQAAKAAAADEFIRRLPHGYDADVGQRGTQLSGGQMQRLAIARALLKDAPILILDEPTAALDAELESELMAGLGLLTNKCTTLVVAHRFSTVMGADKIVVLDRGRILAVGSHSELMDSEPFYREMFQAQFGDQVVTRASRMSDVS